MIAFAFSFLAVWIASYLITSAIKPKKDSIGILYLFLISFAQIVGIFEILSLFNAIKQCPVIIMNILLLGISIFYWIKNKKPIWRPNFSDTKRLINNSLKLDGSLNVLYIAYCFSIVVAIFLCIVYPIVNMDAWSYHAFRCIFWIMNGNLKHFAVSDVRNICLPINSELLYTWVLLFIRKDVFLGFFSFSGYIISMISLYLVMGNMHFSVRKRLWALFILSSFASVIVQISGTEIDIIVAGLVTSAIAIFWYALKNYGKSNDKKETLIPIFMASLAYALAIGTKTTSFFAIPAVAMFMLVLSKKYLKENFYKPFLYFLGFGAINFLIFSSYNYILNLIEFHSISGPSSFIIVSRNYYGFKGLIYNFIRNITLLIDTTGFKWGKYLNPYLTHISNSIIAFFHVNNVKDGLYSLTGVYMNASMLEPIMGAGLLGTFVFLPVIFWTLVKPIKEILTGSRRIQNKTKYLFIFSAMFFINLLIMSYLLCYMTYSVRFITFFIVLSSPVLVCSYMKKSKFIKPIIIFFAVFYFTITATNLWARPFYSYLIYTMRYKLTNSQVKELVTCGAQGTEMSAAGICALRNFIVNNNIPKESKVMVFPSTASGMFLLYNKNLQGYHIYTGLLEDIDNIDLNQYQYIAFPTEQKASTVKYAEKRMNECKVINHKASCAVKREVPCVYKKNTMIPSQYNNNPYNVICSMTNSYLKKKHLQFVGYAYPKASKILTVNKDNTFFVYKNPNYKK